MANRFPLIVNTTSGNSVQELPTGDFLDLSSSGIANSGNITVSGVITATGTVTGSSLLGSVVSVTANITGGNILTGGLISATGNIITSIGANVSGGNILSTYGIYTGGSISATSSITGGNILTTGLISTSGNVVVGGASGAVSANGNIVTAFGGFYGTLASASGNITGGNILTGGLISATSTITGTSHLGAVVSVTANVTGGNVLTGGLISVTGNVIASNVIINGTAAAGSAVLIVSGNIQVTGTNATANIGSVTTYFNTIHGKSTTAQYADLAELYIADAVYLPGTVLDFGGANEVTLSSVASSARVAGVVSTDPAYLMNGMIQADTAVALALMGRAPASVTGTVRKGDMMVSAGNGSAQASAAPVIGTVIGKALEDFDGASGVIEIVVGRL